MLVSVGSWTVTGYRVGKAKFERLAECGKVRASQN